MLGGVAHFDVRQQSLDHRPLRSFRFSRDLYSDFDHTCLAFRILIPAVSVSRPSCWPS
jgi:hypothetical protein